MNQGTQMIEKIYTDERHITVKKSAKFQSKTELFDGDIPSSNFDVELDNLWRQNLVNRDDVISKLIRFTCLHRLYLLMNFQDDRNPLNVHHSKQYSAFSQFTAV